MEIKDNPKVTVLMSVYNGSLMVSDAIESILNQTYRDFEFLIIDDGSTDNSWEIIEAYSKNDHRIRGLQNDGNQGLIASLNRGIKEAKGELLARIDADDIALSNRLELQVNFLNANPSIALCGTGFLTKSETNEKTTRYVADHHDILFKFLTDCHICHGAAMWRNYIFKEHNLTFDPNFQHAEDYDLFARLLTQHNAFNLQEVTMVIRKHDQNVSKVFEDIQRENSLKIRRRLFGQIGVDISPEELDLFALLNYQDFEKTNTHGEAILQLLEKLLSANENSEFFPQNYLSNRLSDFWFHYCYNTRQKRLYKTSRQLKSKNLKNNLKMFLKG